MTPSLSKDEKRTIASRARTLQERLDVPATTGEPIENPRDWIDEWHDRVADGTEEYFEARLERVGSTQEACRKRLQTHGWPSEESLPTWVHRFEELLEFVEAHSITQSHPDGDDRPFVHILSVIVRYAVHRLDHAVLPEQLSDTAFNGLQAAFYDRLELFFSHPLFIEFKTFIAHRNEALVFDQNPPLPDDPRQYYDEFIEYMGNGGLKEFFMEYSFLARLVEIHVGQWIETVEEFCDRLERDYSKLVETFGEEKSLGPVTTINVHGDHHNGGRQIFCLIFESGQKVAYKPRNMEIEAAYYDLLSWVNDTSELPDFRTIDFLCQQAYGWVEWVDPTSSESKADIEHYYRRAGALTCLLYVSGFSDGHLDNIIAVTDQPLVIDLETLAQPKPAAETLPIDTDVRHVVFNSVLQTGLIPMHWPDMDATDSSGFGCSTMHSETNVRKFRRINTDLMDLTYESGATLEADNLPILDGEPIGSEDHTEEITHGFEEMYSFLQDHTEMLLRDDGPFARFSGAEVRYVFRPTDNYARLIAMMTTPPYLRTGLKFGCKVETLARPLIAKTDTDAVWKLYEGERAALRRGDIPKLSTTTESTDLQVEEYKIDDFFEETALDRIRHRLNHLSETDQQEQERYLTWGYSGAIQPDRCSVESEPIDDACAFVDEHAVRYACDIVDRVMADAEYTHGGELTWIRRTLGPDGGVHVHSIKPGLYAGRMGIALFSAAFSALSNERQYQTDTEQIIAPLVDVDNCDEQLIRQGIGGGSGLGAMVYGFTKLGTILDEDHYFEIAHDYLSLLTPSRIANDEQYDVIDGSAGAVLGLLALHEATGNERALDRAVTAGDHLLENTVTHDGIPVWQPISVDRALTGFAHGISGIAYALLRLATVTHLDRFRETALASLTYEHRHYDVEKRNWRDLRSDEAATFMDAWCHGRSGIGLSRLGMAKLGEMEHVRDDLDRALAGVDTTLTASDHVCCGTYSHVEFLVLAARTLGEPIHKERAANLIAASLQRADVQGSFPTKWQTDHWYDPAFFQGVTGIGYSLLRWRDPSLPCVLLWE